MHDEALKSLPELLERLGIRRPILFGHSDGGSIALIHAGELYCRMPGNPGKKRASRTAGSTMTLPYDAPTQAHVEMICSNTDLYADGISERRASEGASEG